MLRNACCLGLIGLILSTPPLSADTGGRTSPPSKASADSGSKRVLWTIVGIGAGFGAGLFLGLNAFDDSINSDRKVWTSALVGAAAGGLAGNLLGRGKGQSPSVRSSGAGRQSAEVSSAAWKAVTSGSPTPDADALSRRVHDINAIAPPR